MNEIKKLRPIDATWAKLDDLFEAGANENVRQSYFLDHSKDQDGDAPSEFSAKYPEYSNYLTNHANNEIYRYCLAVGQHRLEMLSNFSDKETPVALFFRTTPAHKVLGHLLCCKALKEFSNNSDQIGVEVSVVKKAMSIYVSDRTSAAILSDAENRGYINRVMASWNRRIPLVFVTPVMLSDWIRVQLMEWYTAAVTSGLRDAYKKLDTSVSESDNAIAQFIQELDKLRIMQLEKGAELRK
jgi:hypothetical protein